jgi:predicted nucleic acid-binding protein
MNDDSILLDTAVAIYALGIDSEWRLPCQAVLSAISHGDRRAYASVEMIQELVHHRLRRTGDRERSTQQGRDASAICTLLFFDREVLDLSLDLIERIPTIRGRDAVHAATALAYGIETIISPDRAFDGIPGLTRVDPRDFARGTTAR